jgi:hypothetical protein
VLGPGNTVKLSKTSQQGAIFSKPAPHTPAEPQDQLRLTTMSLVITSDGQKPVGHVPGTKLVIQGSMTGALVPVLGENFDGSGGEAPHLQHSTAVHSMESANISAPTD